MDCFSVSSESREREVLLTIKKQDLYARTSRCRKAIGGEGEKMFDAAHWGTSTTTTTTTTTTSSSFSPSSSTSYRQVSCAVIAAVKNNVASDLQML
jgi:hypothetical protein